MRIRVLGCSGAVAAGCKTTAFWLDERILIDAGTGVGDLALDDLAQIDHIVLSHSHLDHILAIPLLADSVLRCRIDRAGEHWQPIRVHALAPTLEALRQHIFNGVVWPDFTRLPTPQRPILALEPFEVGDHLELAGHHIEVLPAAHTVPAVGFAVQGQAGWWVYSGDTGPNPALWRRLRGRAISALIIETAFSNEEAELAAVSGHLAPDMLSQELAQLSGSVPVYITHTKPGEMAAIIEQVRDLNTQHCVQALECGQTFLI